MTNQVGVVIGRFQVDEIHAGHVSLLSHVQSQHPSMLILLGCRRTPQDQLNPMEFVPRAQMLREVFPAAVILPIWDCESDEFWSESVDHVISSIFPGREACLYGGRESFRKHYSGRFKCVTMDFYKTSSGASIREQIAAFPEDKPAFRRGIIFSLMNLQPRIFMTVDIAVVRKKDTRYRRRSGGYTKIKSSYEILVGRKKDATHWRLPGGFWDLKDPDAETAARRELFEETLLKAHDIKYVMSQTIDDWRSLGRNPTP